MSRKTIDEAPKSEAVAPGSGNPEPKDWQAEFKQAQAEEWDLMEKLAVITARRTEAERQLAPPTE